MRGKEIRHVENNRRGDACAGAGSAFRTGLRAGSGGQPSSNQSPAATADADYAIKPAEFGQVQSGAEKASSRECDEVFSGRERNSPQQAIAWRLIECPPPDLRRVSLPKKPSRGWRGGRVVMRRGMRA